MARPISDTYHKVVDLITKRMTDFPDTNRKQLVEFLIKNTDLSVSAVGYYVDRACRPLFHSMRQAK